MPIDCFIEHVEDGETRVVDESDPLVNKSWIVNRALETQSEVLPDSIDPGSLRQATVMLDSGSTNRAGGCFLKNKRRLLISLAYDKFHRVIRDLALTTEATGASELTRAKLQYTFVASQNYKPFGSGQRYHVKRDVLTWFMQTHTVHSAIFRHYAPRIAIDMDLPLRTEADYETVWDALTTLRAYRSSTTTAG